MLFPTFFTSALARTDGSMFGAAPSCKQPHLSFWDHYSVHSRTGLPPRIRTSCVLCRPVNDSYRTCRSYQFLLVVIWWLRTTQEPSPATPSDTRRALPLARRLHTFPLLSTRAYFHAYARAAAAPAARIAVHRARWAVDNGTGTT